MATSPASTQDSAVSISLQILDQLLGGYQRERVAARLWDGTRWGAHDPAFTLVLRNQGSLRNMFLSPSELKLGESYIYDVYDIEGDAEAAARAGEYLMKRHFSTAEKVKLSGLLMRLPHLPRAAVQPEPIKPRGELHSKPRDRVAVTSHYDLSSDFYSLWLDDAMIYSCAYFEKGSEDIHTAQRHKLDYICRKLRLKAGERLLDIGCGWGGLIGHAAKKYGVEACGITLSLPQAEFARKKFVAYEIAERCRVEVCDYRDFEAPEPFDRIVSVGMFEHVGESKLAEYFHRAWTLLRPGGIFLNHGIAANPSYQRRGPSFIEKYVFPDGELVPLATTIRTAEAAGFEVRDVESLREHYVMTLRHWVKRLESAHRQARELVGEVKYRIWRLYMAASAHGFASGRTNLYQVLMSKPDEGRAQLPLTRADWYCAELP